MKGIITGYRTFQQGLLLKQAKGANDVFTPKQQAAADDLMISGILGMVLSAADIVGTGAQVLGAGRAAAGAAGELGPVESFEARAAGRDIEITGVNTESPHVRMTDPEGEVLYDGALQDLEDGLIRGEPHPPGEMSMEERAFVRSTADTPSSQMGTQRMERELEIAQDVKTGSSLPEGGEYVEEIVLENGHTWKRTQDGVWCRFF